MNFCKNIYIREYRLLNSGSVFWEANAQTCSLEHELFMCQEAVNEHEYSILCIEGL